MTRQVPVTSTVVDKRTECRMIPVTEPGTEREIEVPQNLYRQGSILIENMFSQTQVTLPQEKRASKASIFNI